MKHFTIENFAFTINLLIDMVGALLFIALVYVTVKYKKLHHGPCLKLMGLYFLCCLGSKLIIVLPYLIKVVIPRLNVPLFLCAAIQIVPMSMTSAMMPLTMAIAFDRLLSIFFPIWYKKKRSNFYLPALCAIAASYPVYLGLLIFDNVIRNPFIPTNCTTGQLFGRELGIDWIWFFNMFTILCYLVMFAKLLWKGREGRKAYFNRQPIFKSFAVIIGIQTAGWLLTMVGYRYMIALMSGSAHLSEDQIPLLYYSVNYFSSFSSTIEVPAIYFTSSEHRLALQKEFSWLLRPSQQQHNSVAPFINVRVESPKMATVAADNPRGMKEP